MEENNASYPEKINYNNPQHLSLEALEVFYRINASILKYLEMHEGKEIALSLGKTFKKYLDLVTLSKASRVQEIKNDFSTKTKDFKDEQIKIDVEKCLQDIISQVVENESTLKENSGGIVKDVIMISDSDDEKHEKKIENQKDELKDDNQETVLINVDNEKSPVKVVKQANDSVVQDHNYTEKEDADDSSSSSSSSSDSSSSDSDSESTSSSSSSSSSDNTLRNLSDNEVSNLVDKCVAGIQHKSCFLNVESKMTI